MAGWFGGTGVSSANALNTDTQHGVHQPAGIRNNTRATTGTTRIGGDKQHKCSQVHTQKKRHSHICGY